MNTPTHPTQHTHPTHPTRHTRHTAGLPIGRAVIDHALGRLRHARKDSRNLPTAYPILARWGEMETTANGFFAIDPETANRRIDRLIEKLSAL